MTSNLKMNMHRTIAKIPMAVLFLLILYLYAVYMATYLINLLNDNYLYQPTLVHSTGPVFLTINSINHHTNKFVGLLQSEEIELSPSEQKGAIYFTVCHVLIFLFLLSLYKTIVTPPGGVSNDWNLRVQEELFRATEAEAESLSQKLKQRREQSKIKERKSHVIVINKEGKVENKPTIEGSPEKSGRKSVGSAVGTPMKDPQDQHDPEKDNQENEAYDEFLKDREQLFEIAKHNIMKKEKRRYCGHCEKLKPQRTHHCRQCNTCILKMDHHCPWVNNCIGLRNYKYFINMVFYGVLLLWFLMFTYSEPISDIIGNPQINFKMVYLAFTTYLLICTLAAIITAFFFFHLWLILKGTTTLEFVERKNSNEYNTGILRNIRYVFGLNAFTWCLPCYPGPKDDGVGFEKREINDGL